MPDATFKPSEVYASSSSKFIVWPLLTFKTRRYRETHPPGVGAGEGVAEGGQAPARGKLWMSADVSVKIGLLSTPSALSAKMVYPTLRVLHALTPQVLKARLKKVRFWRMYVAPRSTIQYSRGPLPSEW